MATSHKSHRKALAKVRGGYKVRKLNKGGFMSKKPLSKAKARRQLAAYFVNKKRRGY